MRIIMGILLAVIIVGVIAAAGMPIIFTAVGQANQTANLSSFPFLAEAIDGGPLILWLIAIAGVFYILWRFGVGDYVMTRVKRR